MSGVFAAGSDCIGVTGVRGLRRRQSLAVRLLAEVPERRVVAPGIFECGSRSVIDTYSQVSVVNFNV